MTDFSDRPLVAGSLIGLRSFSVDNLGRLYGPSYNQVFRPGENEATCRKGEDHSGNWFTLPTMKLQTVSFYSSLSDPVAAPAKKPWPKGKNRLSFISDDGSEVDITGHLADEAVESKVPRKPPHTLASIDCQCGFYAYFDGLNDYAKSDRLTAIIEGYGVCTVGTRGFRASKARLLGIVAPPEHGPNEIRIVTFGGETARKLSPHQMQLVLRNYPDVPVYATKAAALEAHPLTAPDVPGPDSPDFWDRPVKS